MITLKGYKILKKLGSGGMGDVYLAEHELIHRKVAIKVLHKHLVSDKEFIKRFRREAKLLASLDHHNIVRLNEYFENDGEFFLIMEYVDGLELDQYINTISGPIVEAELIPMFKQMLDAMGYAHKKGLVHRDIKPANILISNEGKVKVLDFGIAKLKTDDQGLTNAGVQVGTITYMSPEQVRAEQVDLQSDIYSLGVTLYQMAVGKAPYLNSKVFDTQMKIVKDPFPRAKDIYPGVSDQIENIIQKATQKDKKDRYLTCEEFKKAFDFNNIISPNLEKDNIKNKKLKDIKLVKEQKVEKKKISLLSKLFFGVLFFGILILSYLYFFPQNSEFNYLEHYKKGVKYSKNQNYQLALDEFSICVDADSENDSVLFQRGLCLLKLEQYNKSINDFSKAIVLNPSIAKYYTKRADVLCQLANYKDAVKDYAKAIVLKPDAVYNFNARGVCYQYLNNYKKSIPDFTKAISIEPKSFSFLKRGIGYFKLVANNETRINYNNAIEDFTTAISLDLNSSEAYRYRGEVKQSVGIYYEISFCADYLKSCELGNNEACLTNNKFCNTKIEKVEEELKIKADNINPPSSEYFKIKAEKYFDDENYKLAIKNCDKVLSLEPKNYLMFFIRGSSNKKLENFEDAISDFSEAIIIQNDNESYFLRGESKQSLNLSFCGDFNKACELGYSLACKSYEISCKNINSDKISKLKNKPKPNTKPASWYFKRAGQYNDFEKYKLAIIEYSEVISIKPSYKDAYFNRGMIYLKLKEYEKALDDFTEALLLNTNNKMAYYNRGLCKSIVGRGDFCIDFKNSCKLGYKISCDKFDDDCY